MTNLTDLGNKGINGVAFDPEALAIELEAYGESEAAKSMIYISSETQAKISELALDKMITDSLTTDKAICLAAIQVFEGNSRELKRKRRVYPEK